MTIIELYNLHAGNLKCKICGDVASSTNMTCSTCKMIDKFIDNSIDDILGDLGPLLTISIPDDFVESVIAPKAGSISSRRLLHILRKVSEEIEERKPGS